MNIAPNTPPEIPRNSGKPHCHPVNSFPYRVAKRTNLPVPKGFRARNLATPWWDFGEFGGARDTEKRVLRVWIGDNGPCICVNVRKESPLLECLKGAVPRCCLLCGYVDGWSMIYALTLYTRCPYRPRTKSLMVNAYCSRTIIVTARPHQIQLGFNYFFKWVSYHHTQTNRRRRKKHRK